MPALVTNEHRVQLPALSSNSRFVASDEHAGHLGVTLGGVMFGRLKSYHRRCVTVIKRL